MSDRQKKECITAYLFLLPDLAGLIIFVILPIIYAFYISFFHWDFVSDKIFAGFFNYKKMLNDINWWKSLERTFQLTLMYVPGLFIIALFLAVLVSQVKSRAESFIKTSFLMPFAITSVIASTLWMFLFNEKRGYINGFLAVFGIGNQSFIGSDKQALPAIVIVLLWINIGYNMVLFLSAIKDIPASYQEAATIDGANKIHIFRYITFPLIKQTSIFILITTTIASFQVLDIIMVMTKGGPAKSTEVAALYIYEKSFQMMDIGYGSALSVFLFCILLIFSLIQMKITDSRKKV